jgi:alkylhydroperoxidase family enzyme
MSDENGDDRLIAMSRRFAAALDAVFEDSGTVGVSKEVLVQLMVILAIEHAVDRLTAQIGALHETLKNRGLGE